MIAYIVLLLFHIYIYIYIYVCMYVFLLFIINNYIFIIQIFIEYYKTRWLIHINIYIRKNTLSVLESHRFKPEILILQFPKS